MKTPFFALIFIKVASLCLLLFSFSLMGPVGCSQKRFHLEDQDVDYVAKGLFNYSADILWIVDNSSTMQKYQQLLLDKIDPFLESLEASKIDFRLGLTSTDMGPGGTGGQFIGIPAILTAKIPQWKPLFKTRFLLGERGSNNERGLDSMKALLTRRKDFLRSESPLIVIVLTDEEDFSVGKLEYYTQFLNKIKPIFKVNNSRTWQIHFFGVLSRKDFGPNCPLAKRLYPSHRYLKLVQLSGGMAISLCSAGLQFEQSLNQIKNRISQFFTDYKLNQLPKKETFEIRINDREIPENSENGWLYHEKGNFIRFYGKFIPLPRDSVKILFSPEEGKL